MAASKTYTNFHFNLNSLSTKETLKDPLGYRSATTDISVRASGRRDTYTEVLENKAWEFGKSPSKQIFITLFMFWMTGNAMSIWTIMITIAFVLNPLKSIFGVNQAFTQFEHKKINLLGPKLLYLLFNFVILGAALYKFSVMGIIPVAPYDWVGLINSKVPIEHSQVVVSSRGL